MFKLSIKTQILVFTIFLYAAGNVHGVTFNVNHNGDMVDVLPGNGICVDASGNCTLRAAVMEANALSSDDEIAFNPALSGQTILLGSVITITNNGTLKINGLGANVLTVSGNNLTRIFTVNTGASAVISHLTMTNGSVSGTNGTNGTNGTGQNGGQGGQATGGGVLNNGSLTMSFVIVRNCVAAGGRGGDGGNGTTGPVGGNGGAGGPGGSALGGGIHNTGTLYFSNSTVTANQANGAFGGRGGNGGVGSLSTGNGGAGGPGGNGSGNIYNSGTVFVVNSTISSNQTLNGGGGLGGSGSMNGNGGLFGNSNGGGFHNTNTANLRNVTIAGNQAQSGTGGGIFNSGTVNSGNTLVSDNTATNSPDISGAINSLGYNLFRNTTGATIGGTTTGNLTNVDPLLGTLQNNGGETLTRSLSAGSPAINAGNNALAVDQNGVPTPFDQRGACYRRIFGTSADIGAFEFGATAACATTAFDFDGDNKTDISIFRPASGEWWYLRSSNGGNRAFQFGTSSDKLVPADFTGDGKTDIAFWRPSTGTWFILRSEDSSFFAFPFGVSGDTPVPSDYDGDGKADAAVFRSSSSTWFIQNSSGGTTIQQFGVADDAPVPADYDGDGKTDIAIFRPNAANGAQWWIQRSSNNSVTAFQFGASTDKAVQADYTGDGKSDPAFWRPSTGFWFVLRSEDSSFFSFPFGASGDTPVSGDYDGDGRMDAAVFRSSNSTWFIQRSTAGTLIQAFGITGDLPIPNAFVP